MPSDVKKDGKNKSSEKNKRHFFKDFKAELKRVIWPTPKQLINNTLAVIVMVLITAVIVFVLDFAFEKLNTYGINNLKNYVDSSNTNSTNEISNEASNNTTNETDTEANTNELDANGVAEPTGETNENTPEENVIPEGNE